MHGQLRLSYCNWIKIKKLFRALLTMHGHLRVYKQLNNVWTTQAGVVQVLISCGKRLTMHGQLGVYKQLNNVLTTQAEEVQVLISCGKRLTILREYKQLNNEWVTHPWVLIKKTLHLSNVN
jgi:hypothetical protein